MLPFLSFGLLSATGLVVGRRFANKRKKQRAKQDTDHTPVSVQIVGHRILEEKTQILAREEIPMDNRFGNKTLSSEHEFSQTASVSVELGDHRRLATLKRSSLWKILENKTELELGKNLGVDIGSQISRRVRLKFATDPGQFVRYQVVWIQQGRRGTFTVRAGKRTLHLPYMVAYGLSHRVDSLPGESVAPAPAPSPAPSPE